MRKIFFWLHLCLGVAAGAVILIMSVTGVLLTYEKQTVTWMDTRDLPSLAQGGRLPVETLLERGRGADGKLPLAIMVSSDAAKPVQLTVGREARYIDPVNGNTLGTGHAGVRQFFRMVTEWHRYLGASGSSRPTGRALTGAANFGFLFIVLSGLYLWLPKVWSQASVRAITWFRGGLAGKARDFNWHNVIGVWCFVPLVFIVLGGTVISYPWASNLVFTLTGSEVPRPPPPPKPDAVTQVPALTGLDQIFQQASAKVPDWRTITLRMPVSTSAPV